LSLSFPTSVKNGLSQTGRPFLLLGASCQREWPQFLTLPASLAWGSDERPIGTGVSAHYFRFRKNSKEGSKWENQ
jgi:hypothetical protein